MYEQKCVQGSPSKKRRVIRIISRDTYQINVTSLLYASHIFCMCLSRDVSNGVPCTHYCSYTSLLMHLSLDTGWPRLIGSPKLHIIFHKRATKYRALLRKMTYKDKGSSESSPPCTSLLHASHILFICISRDVSDGVPCTHYS